MHSKLQKVIKILLTFTLVISNIYTIIPVLAEDIEQKESTNVQKDNEKIGLEESKENSQETNVSEDEESESTNLFIDVNKEETEQDTNDSIQNKSDEIKNEEKAETADSDLEKENTFDDQKPSEESPVESKSKDIISEDLHNEESPKVDIEGYVYSLEENRRRAMEIMEQDLQPTPAIGLFRSRALSHTQVFINQFSPLAVKHANAKGLYPSVMLAQAILESGWGGSKLSQAPYHQLFGIKDSKDFSGQTIRVNTQEWIKDSNYENGGYMITIPATFRVYASYEDSFSDQGNFLQKTRYKKVLRKNAPTYKHAIQALKDGGYATDPDYVEKINSIVSGYELWRLDELPSVSYSSHIQKEGWMARQNDGGKSGTTGQKKRMESIKINVSNFNNLGIRYNTFVDGKSWSGWSNDGAESGTTGESRSIEALKMELTGSQANNFDVYYRLHVESYGWLDWAKNGQVAGSEDILNKQIEAMEIRIIRKGNQAPGPISSYYRIDKIVPEYTTHVQSKGWLNKVTAGKSSGTVGKRKRLEAIKLELRNSSLNGDIKYRTHVQSDGWLNWVKNDQISGTTGQSKRMEAIQIELTGEIAKHYDVYYRVHSEYHGWLDWAKNGQKAGTEGKSRRMEAIEIKLVRKGNSAPGKTNRPYVN